MAVNDCLAETLKRQATYFAKTKGKKMFIRPSLVKTQIQKNKKGKKVLMKTLGLFELHKLVDRTYNEFFLGKTIDKIFQENSVSKKHKHDYSILILNRFLKEFDGKINYNDQSQLKNLSKIAKLSVIDNTLDLGFIYCIKVHDKIKIGRTTDFTKRLGNYKSHIGTTPCILKIIFVAKHNEVEDNFIKKLSAIGITNEWFSETHKDLIISLFEL